MSLGAVTYCLESYRTNVIPEREQERAAVKYVLSYLTETVPGRSVELRVPPYAAVQIIDGPIHRRGTPSSVVEMTAKSLLLLAHGENSWEQLQSAGAISASGERSDLSALFPLRIGQ